jgi:hypothetical protein
LFLLFPVSRASASARPPSPLASPPPIPSPVPPSLRDAAALTAPSFAPARPRFPLHTPPPLPHRRRTPPPCRVVAVPHPPPELPSSPSILIRCRRLPLPSTPCVPPASSNPRPKFFHCLPNRHLRRLLHAERAGRRAWVTGSDSGDHRRRCLGFERALCGSKARASTPTAPSHSSGAGGPLPLWRRPSTRVYMSTQGTVKQQPHAAPITAPNLRMCGRGCRMQ